MIVRTGANLPLELYADKFGSPSDDWGARINAAINAAYVGDDPAAPATIVLPVGKLSRYRRDLGCILLKMTAISLLTGTLNVSTPIKLWRQRKVPPHIDTTADNVSAFADIGQVWESIRGGEVTDLPAGFRLRGVPGGGYGHGELSTRLRWVGANDSVMIDMPAPWHCHLSDFMLDGTATKGLIGIRYRAGCKCSLCVFLRSLKDAAAQTSLVQTEAR